MKIFHKKEFIDNLEKEIKALISYSDGEITCRQIFITINEEIDETCRRYEDCWQIVMNLNPLKYYRNERDKSKITEIAKEELEKLVEESDFYKEILNKWE